MYLKLNKFPEKSTIAYVDVTSDERTKNSPNSTKKLEVKRTPYVYLIHLGPNYLC